MPGEGHQRGCLLQLEEKVRWFGTLIEELMPKAKQPTHVTQLTGTDELRKQAWLKQQGISTEQEYEQKKKQLLGL